VAVSDLEKVLGILRLWVDATAQLSATPAPPLWRFGKRFVHSQRIAYAGQRLALYNVIDAVRNDLQEVADETIRDHIADRIAWYLVLGLEIVIRAEQGVPVALLSGAFEPVVTQLTHEMREAFNTYREALSAIRDESVRRSKLAAATARTGLRERSAGVSETAIAIMDETHKLDLQATADHLAMGERALKSAISKHRARIGFNYRALKWLFKGGSLATAAALSGVPTMLAHRELLFTFTLAQEAVNTFVVDPAIKESETTVAAAFDRYVAIDGSMNLIQAGVTVLGSLLIKQTLQQQRFAALLAER
jgi:hypothetical protein